MSCRDFTSTNPACRTVTLIEPDSTLLGSTFSGSTDRSLDESGSTPIAIGDTRLVVFFETIKASDNYRFEYLYVAPNGTIYPAADISVIPVVQTVYGFWADLVGVPLVTGYTLHWRVVVIDITTTPQADTPETVRVALPVNARSMVVNWVIPRSDTLYRFSELRVENLIDPVATQRIILVQVVAKTVGSFTIGISPRADTANYFLCARTP